MKTQLEVQMFRNALNRTTTPGTTLTSFHIDLPQSTGKLHMCVYREPQWCQLTALLLPTFQWDYTNPPKPRGDLVLPDYVVRTIRDTLRFFGIRHIIGIMPESKVPRGVLLRDMYPHTPHMGTIH